MSLVGLVLSIDVQIARLTHILDLFAGDSWCNVYAGEREVRPPLTRQQGLEALPVGSLRHEP